jgi:chromosome segregation ATPase
MSDNGQDDKPQDAAPDMDPGAGASVPSIMYNGNQVQQEVVAAVNSTMAVGNQMIAPLLFRAQTLEWLLMRSQGTVFTLQQMMSVLSFKEQEHHQLLEGMMNENSRLVDKCNRLEQNRALAMGDAGEFFDAIDSTVTHLEQFLLYTQRAAHGDKSFERWMLKAVQLEYDNDELKKQVASLEKELSTSRLEVEVYGEVCQDLRTDLGKVQAQMRTEVEKLQAQLRIEKKKGSVNQQGQMQGLVEHLRAQLKKLSNDMGQFCDHFGKEAKKLTAVIEHSKKQSEALKVAMEKTTKQNEALKVAMEKTTKQSEALKVAMEKTTKQNEALKVALAKAKKDAADTEMSLKDANQGLRNENQKLKEEIKRAREEVQKDKDNSLQDANNDLRKENNKMKGEINKVKEEAQKLAAEVDALKLSVATNKAQSGEKIQALKAKVVELEKNNEKIPALKAKGVELEAELKKKEKEISGLETKVTKSEIKNLQLAQRLAALLNAQSALLGAQSIQ